MKSLISVLPLCLHLTSALICASPLSLAPAAFAWGAVALGIALYPVVLVSLAAAVARIGLPHVKAGHFERDPRTPLYRGRLIYAAAWTTLYYCKPILHLVTSVAPLKRLAFRGFGYRGSLNFTTYPDTWMRDLALLDFGEGTYVSNRATLGTNIVRSDRTILVDGIRTGRNALIGHLSMIAPGVTIGDDSEIGVGAGIGLKVRIGARVTVGPKATIDHGARLMDDVVVGTNAYVGKRCVLHPGVRIPAGAIIPDRSVLRPEVALPTVAASQPRAVTFVRSA